MKFYSNFNEIDSDNTDDLSCFVTNISQQLWDELSNNPEVVKAYCMLYALLVDPSKDENQSNYEKNHYLLINNYAALVGKPDKNGNRRTLIDVAKKAAYDFKYVLIAGLKKTKGNFNGTDADLNKIAVIFGTKVKEIGGKYVVSQSPTAIPIKQKPNNHAAPQKTQSSPKKETISPVQQQMEQPVHPFPGIYKPLQTDLEVRRAYQDLLKSLQNSPDTSGKVLKKWFDKNNPAYYKLLTKYAACSVAEDGISKRAISEQALSDMKTILKACGSIVNEGMLRSRARNLYADQFKADVYYLASDMEYRGFKDELAATQKKNQGNQKSQSSSESSKKSWFDIFK